MTEREMMLRVLSRFSGCSIVEDQLDNGYTYTEVSIDGTYIGVTFDTEGNVVNMEG